MVDVIPRVLYKYFSINDQYSSVHRLLNNQQLYFREPNFNDPFDCKINIKLPVEDNEKDAFAKSMAETNKKRYGLDYSTEYQKFREGLDQPDILKRIRISTLQSGILCLSERYNDLLMWAHYANSHSGICIGFDFTNLHEMMPLRVKYQNNYPDFQLAIEGFVDSVILTKSEDWRYEQEWRIVTSKAGYRDIHSTRISEVIFGCEITASDRKDVLDMLNKVELMHVRIYEAKVSDKSFTLNINKIDPFFKSK